LARTTTIGKLSSRDTNHKAQTFQKGQQQYPNHPQTLRQLQDL